MKWRQKNESRWKYLEAKRKAGKISIWKQIEIDMQISVKETIRTVKLKGQILKMIVRVIEKLVNLLTEFLGTLCDGF